MKLDFAFLANAAKVQDNGLFAVIGGGIECLYMEQFPNTYQSMALVCRVRCDPSECGKPLKIHAEIVAPDGTIIPPVRWIQFAQGKHPRNPANRSSVATFCFNYPSISFPTPGDYSFRLFTGTETLGKAVLELVPARGPHMANSLNNGVPIYKFDCITPHGPHTFAIKIPTHERFRVHDILLHDEYRIPGLDNQQAPLQIMDVGANVGVYTLYMKAFYPNSFVHCYEPIPSTLENLRWNASYLSAVAIHDYGLWSSDGVQEFSIHANSGQNSLKPQANQLYQDKIKAVVRNAGQEFDRLALGHLDILKIDTEGCEVEILESLGEARLGKIAHILLEYHSMHDRQRVCELLNGFQIVGDTLGASGILIFANRTRIRNSSATP